MTTAATVTDAQIHAAQGGDADALWQIVDAYDPMLKSVVRSVAPSAGQDDVEDLLQEARMVLIQHLREYSTESSSARLSSYAYPAIRKAIATAWLNATTTLSVEPSAAFVVKRALFSEGGDVEAAWTSISKEADPKRRISREAFVSVCEALVAADPLDAPIGSPDGSSHTLADTIPDTGADFTDVSERRDLARWLLTQIPPRQAFALRAFYGIGMQVMTDEEAADDLRVRRAADVRVLRTRGIGSAQTVARGNHISLAA